LTGAVAEPLRLVLRRSGGGDPIAPEQVGSTDLFTVQGTTLNYVGVGDGLTSTMETETYPVDSADRLVQRQGPIGSSTSTAALLPRFTAPMITWMPSPTTTRSRSIWAVTTRRATPACAEMSPNPTVVKTVTVK